MNLQSHYDKAFDGGLDQYYPIRGSGKDYDNFMKFFSNPVGTIKDTIQKGKDMLGQLGFGIEDVDDRAVMDGGEDVDGGLLGEPGHGVRKLIGGPAGMRKLIVENIQPAHMTGGKIAVKDLKRFIDSSYERKDKDGKIKQKEQNISGYILDPELTRDESSVYYNPTTNHVIHNIRGTNGTAKDWSNNAVYAASPYLYQKLDRFKRSKKNQEAVERKYANAKKSITTHSQSGIIGRYLAKDRPDTEIIQLNPASSYKDNDVNKNDKNVYTVKSTKDVVSLFHKNQPQDIVIPGESLDQFKEHDIGLLDRLEPDKQIGFGRNKFLTPLLF
jgi:hypothetical protein